MWGHKISGLCSQLSYTPIGGVILSDLFGKCKYFFLKSENFLSGGNGSYMRSVVSSSWRMRASAENRV